jgi:hypothetical protein
MKAVLVTLFFFQATDMPLLQPKDLALHLDASRNTSRFGRQLPGVGATIREVRAPTRSRVA